MHIAISLLIYFCGAASLYILGANLSAYAEKVAQALQREPTIIH